MTRKSYERLSKEARRLREEEIPRLSREKCEAAAQGDLRENAGYEAARDRLNLIGARLRQIDEQLSGAQFIEDLRISCEVVSLGTKVKLINLDDGMEIEYKILGSADADHAAGVISYASPIARGMIGKRMGEEAVIAIPEGTRRFRVAGIERYD